MLERMKNTLFIKKLPNLEYLCIKLIPRFTMEDAGQRFQHGLIILIQKHSTFSKYFMILNTKKSSVLLTRLKLTTMSGMTKTLVFGLI